MLELLQVGSTIWVGFLAMVTGNNNHMLHHGSIVILPITKVKRYLEEQGMRLVALLCACLFLPSVAESACPTRANSYVAGTIISPTAVTSNEDALFEGIQSGLETACIADNAITTAKIAVGAVTSSDILDGTVTTTDLAFVINSGNALPVGAVFFMVTGSCPSWTTDVTATYSNLFVRVNATQGTLGGGNTHEHTAGTFAGTSHTHSIPNAIGDNSGGATDTGGGQQYSLDDHTHNSATGSGGGGAISGTSASGANVPGFVTAILCRVD